MGIYCNNNNFWSKASSDDINFLSGSFFLPLNWDRNPCGTFGMELLGRYAAELLSESCLIHHLSYWYLSSQLDVTNSKSRAQKIGVISTWYIVCKVEAIGYIVTYGTAVSGSKSFLGQAGNRFSRKYTTLWMFQLLKDVFPLNNKGVLCTRCYRLSFHLIRLLNQQRCSQSSISLCNHFAS